MTLKEQHLSARLAAGVPIPGPPGPQGPPGPPGSSITSQNVVTANRSADIVYHNAGATALLVKTTWDLSGQNAQIIALADSNSPPATIVGALGDPNQKGVITEMFFVVLPGHYYECSTQAGAPVLKLWIEYA